ncbi:MFS transporter [Planctomyces sp. SH-PL14]|uniref:MFS transporter n=1 Tax=Planctomyces sp. SH-PL14 TaxID=1632864 RepID=UPI00078C7FC7|nr:MFS transporter [Planctomyces sp. SH-PL14]AMV19902.1 2-acyl-glycerophospho-ethanolamine acyltransferase [Planctomyces sp. SH-PL14]
MSQDSAAPDAASSPPRLSIWKDRAFWGMTVTQFLGALNDNIFKQLVLLLCVDLARQGRTDRQGIATILFALPFILGSGFSGFLADKWSKRSIVVGCKIAEVMIAALGMAAFAGMERIPDSGIWLPIAVLALMGAHSTVFGPAKFGILPELFDDRDLPRVNGVILMTTFLAIILALPLAGSLKMMFEGRVWMASTTCLVVASLGVVTSLMVRRTPVAHPGLQFEPASLFVHPTTWRALVRQRGLLAVVIVLSVFWMTGGIVYPNVTNAVGKIQMGLNDERTGLLAACTGLGILVGCVLAGWLSHSRFNAKLVRIGGWGIVVSLALLAIPGSDVRPVVEAAGAEPVQPPAAVGVVPPAELADPPLPVVHRQPFLGLAGTAIALVAVGFFAGVFTVPLQVFLQARAPHDQKGRVIGVMNLCNWLGIASAGFLYQLFQWIFVGIFRAPLNLLYLGAAIVILPVLLLYHPQDESLQETRAESAV